jgi:DNA-directed RNA polymerase specialized sigma subunit
MKIYRFDELSLKEQNILCNLDSYINKLIGGNCQKYFSRLKNANTVSLDDDTIYIQDPNLILNVDFFEGLLFDKMPVHIENTKLIEALETLNEKQLQIILLYYFCNMNDYDIEIMLKVRRRTINNNRNKALDKLRNYLRRDFNEET